MPKKEYQIKLMDEERTTLIALTKKGTIAARKLARAHILRLADEGVNVKGIGSSLKKVSLLASTRKGRPDRLPSIRSGVTLRQGACIDGLPGYHLAFLPSP